MEIPPPTLENVLFNEACQRSIIHDVCEFMLKIGQYTCKPLLGEELPEENPKGAGHQTSASFLSCDRKETLSIDFLDFEKLSTKIKTHKHSSDPLFLTWMTLWCMFVSEPIRQEFVFLYSIICMVTF